MSADPHLPASARRIVDARLGREPQDMLEAAVVLEAWAGMPADEALRSGRRSMARRPRPSRAPAPAACPAPAPQDGLAVEALSFVIAVVAIAAWAAPLSEPRRQRGRRDRADLGAADDARPAVGARQPLPEPARGRRPPRPPAAAAAARRRRRSSPCPTLFMGRSGAVAGLLTLTWTGGTIVIRRRWSLGLRRHGRAGQRRDGRRDAGDQRARVHRRADHRRRRGRRPRAGRADRPPARPLGPRRPGRGDRRGRGRRARHRPQRRLERRLDAGALPAAVEPGELLGRLPPVALPAGDPRDAVGRGRARRAPARPRARARCASSLGAVARLVAGHDRAVAAARRRSRRRSSSRPSGNTVLVGFGLVALATLFVGLLESVGPRRLGARRPRRWASPPRSRRCS